MAAAEALGKKLDPGQRLGNGAASAAAVRKLMDDDATGEGDAPPEKLDASDPDRYQMARILKVEEEGRKLRRQNAEADGAYVLADAAGRAAARQLAAEIAGFETVIRDGARAIADELSVDFKTARTILLRTWRAHRKGRAETLESDAAAAVLADDEKAANI